MTTALRESIIVDEALRSEAEDFINRVDGIRVSGIEVKLSNGETFAMPPRLARFFELVLDAATAQSTRIMSLPDELTTTVAADQLGISRPTLMKWVHQGKIQSHKVGSHHRFMTKDVQQLARELQEEKERAFEALRVVDEQLEDW